MATVRPLERPQLQRGLPTGWPVVGWCALGLLTIATIVLAVDGTGEAGLRTLIRVSALTSLLLFSSGFTASALNRLLRTPVSRWLLANRRYLGVSFAISHAVHLVPIVVLASTVPDFRANPTTLVFGGFGYVVLAAMTATSFDRTTAWLGPRAWKRLHTFGVYYLWFIFAASYIPRVAGARWYLFHSTVLVAALALRLYGRAKI